MKKYLMILFFTLVTTGCTVGGGFGMGNGSAGVGVSTGIAF